MGSRELGKGKAFGMQTKNIKKKKERKKECLVSAARDIPVIMSLSLEQIKYSKHSVPNLFGCACSAHYYGIMFSILHGYKLKHREDLISLGSQSDWQWWEQRLAPQSPGPAHSVPNHRYVALLLRPHSVPWKGCPLAWEDEGTWEASEDQRGRIKTSDCGRPGEHSEYSLENTWLAST